MSIRSLFLFAVFSLIANPSFAEISDKQAFEIRLAAKKKELGATPSVFKGVEESIEKYIENRERDKEHRSYRSSWHYVDAVLNFTGQKVHHLTRTSSGEWINKVDKHTEKPQLNTDDVYLGHFELEYMPPEKIIRFFPADPNLQPVEILHHQLIEIPELNLGFGRTLDDGEIHVRVFNYKRPFDELFSNPEFFSYNPELRVEALFTPFKEPLVTEVPKSSGEMGRSQVYGTVEFLLNDRYYRLYSYGRGQIRFTDESMGSYPGGRYLRASSKEDREKGYFVMDFNHAYPPPCAYSQTYTCSLPLPEEHIDQEVSSGRKYPLNYLK